ncbi:MAG: SurA N-terminal domain-containing protein [Desulfatiglandales bacterium]|jgi:peptidyl-prolyl cis-trans isomerase SurA|nr:SurA N-terminal domain-containing protein [Desulfatiglandales bacterium]
MKGIRSTGILIFLVIIVLILFQPVSSEIFNRVVAVVNDEVITLHELNQKIKKTTGLTPEGLRLRDEGMYLQTRRRILDLMIDDRIAQKKIQELGINVASRQIDEAIEKIKQDNQWTHEDLMAGLKKSRMDFKKYREGIKRDLEHFRLIDFEVKSKIIIREEQVSRYYEKHMEEFTRIGNVHLASIFLMREDPEDEGEMRELYQKGENILSRLKKGEDFGELAKEFSEGPGADDGGDIGLFKTSDLEPKLRKLCKMMPEGGFSDLIIRPNSIQVIKLVKKQKAEIKPLGEVRNAIYGTLFQKEVNKRYSSWIGALRKGSYTKIIF